MIRCALAGSGERCGIINSKVEMKANVKLSSLEQP